MNVIKTQVSLLHQFIQESFKKPFLTITAVFFGIIVASFVFFYINKDLTIQAMNWIQSLFSSKDIVDELGNISALGLIKNNLQACLMSTALGLVPFLFLNFFSLITNTVVIGIACAGAMLSGQSMLFLFAALIPHGIFEIPAIVISITLGYLLCKELVMTILGNRQGVPLRLIFLNVARMYLFILVPCVIVAGFIEAYITPVVTGFVL